MTEEQGAEVIQLLTRILTVLKSNPEFVEWDEEHQDILDEANK